MATDAEKLGRTVVLDYGSDTIKAGRARDVPSENALSCATPAAVEARDPSAGPDDVTAPDGTPWPRRAAVQRGRVVDFDAFESLLHHVLYDRMRWKRGQEDCLVVVEPVLASRAEREAIVQLAFESIGVRGFFVADAAACALYTCNKQIGLSVDIGHGKAVVASVAEGATHIAGAAELPWAGENLEAYTRHLLARSAGATAAQALTPEQIRALKDQATCLAASVEDYGVISASDAPRARVDAVESAAAAAAADKQQQQQAAAHAEAWRRARGEFALPDGTSLKLGSLGYSLGEAIMRPASAGLTAPTLAEVCCEVVAQQPEVNARRAIWETVLVSGGVGTAPGFRERLLEELPLFGPSSASFASASVPHYFPTYARQHAAWIGGTVLSRVAMHQMISAQEYEEHGPAVVARII